MFWKNCCDKTAMPSQRPAVRAELTWSSHCTALGNNWQSLILPPMQTLSGPNSVIKLSFSKDPDCFEFAKEKPSGSLKNPVFTLISVACGDALADASPVGADSSPLAQEVAPNRSTPIATKRTAPHFCTLDLIARPPKM